MEFASLPPWAQVAVGFPLLVVSAYVVIAKFFKEMRRPESKPVVLEAAELADMNPVRALAPALQRLYEVQSEIDSKLDRQIDGQARQTEVQARIDERLKEVVELLERQEHAANLNREVTRARQEERDKWMRTGPRGIAET